MRDLEKGPFEHAVLIVRWTLPEVRGDSWAARPYVDQLQPGSYVHEISRSGILS